MRSLLPRCRTGAGLLAVLPVLLLSCAGEPDAGDPGWPDDFAGCLAPDPARLDEFRPCTTGGGSFGHWVLGDRGLPAYEYTLDQRTDPRAEWEMTTGEQRRDHWFQLGNDRVIALATTDGYVSLFVRERGPLFLNWIDRDNDRTGGGYSYLIEADGEVWATPFALAPAGAATRRRFGLGAVENRTVHRDLAVTHRILAPPGDEAVVLHEVTLHNQGAARRAVTHVNFWDVNRHSLELQLTVSGTLDPSVPAAVHESRRKLNRWFELGVDVDAAAGTARITHAYLGDDALADGAPSPRDSFPRDVVFARLAPSPAAVPLVLHSDRDAFLGAGGPAAPAALASGSSPAPPPDGINARGQRVVLADEVPLDLAPGEEITLRYLFGQVAPGRPLDGLVAAFATDAYEPGVAQVDHWTAVVPHVYAPAAPFLHREMAWHAAMLQGASVFEDYYRAHTVVQGSAYLYLHGLDGAARDFSLFSIPLVYLRPDLARELLRTIMRTTYGPDQEIEADQISYAVQGYGVVETAVIHRTPSDLDLAFLWALSEYLQATGDGAFLEEPNPYWPVGSRPDEPTWQHARRAVRHLIDLVGRGEHGLIRVRTGDWSDGITAESGNMFEVEKIGESVPNTQMALWVLPRVAGWLAVYDPELAAEALAYGDELRGPALDQWLDAPGWYRRAWFGPEAPVGDDGVNLESQVWALIGHLPDDAQLRRLQDVIWTQLEEPSLVGARRVSWGNIWHAISGLLTWGHAEHDAERAWRALTRHTLHAFGEANPDNWYGIWSGPDAIGREGGTWASEATPMRDFPVMNANAHAMPLIGVLRVAGITPAPTGDGLRIAPAIPAGEEFAIRLPLLELAVDAQGGIRGAYTALNDGQIYLYVAVPEGAVQARVGDARLPLEEGQDEVQLPLVFSRGDRIEFSVGQ